MSRPPHLSIWLDSTLENVALAGPAVHQAARGAGFSRDQAYLLQLAVVEAANNAVLHAYGGRPGNPVELTARLEPGRLVLTISDRGTAMADFSPRRLDFDPKDMGSLPEGGMGLFLIHLVCDQVQYISRHGQNTLRLVKRIPEPG